MNYQSGFKAAIEKAAGVCEENMKSRSRNWEWAARDCRDKILSLQPDETVSDEPVAYRYDFDGYGYLYIDNGSGSHWNSKEWLATHPDAEPVFAHPTPNASAAMERKS